MQRFSSIRLRLSNPVFSMQHPQFAAVCSCITGDGTMLELWQSLRFEKSSCHNKLEDQNHWQLQSLSLNHLGRALVMNINRRRTTLQNKHTALDATPFMSPEIKAHQHMAGLQAGCRERQAQRKESHKALQHSYLHGACEGNEC